MLAVTLQHPTIDQLFSLLYQPKDELRPELMAIIVPSEFTQVINTRKESKSKTSMVDPDL